MNQQIKLINILNLTINLKFQYQPSNQMIIYCTKEVVKMQKIEEIGQNCRLQKKRKKKCFQVVKSQISSRVK